MATNLKGVLPDAKGHLDDRARLSGPRVVSFSSTYIKDDSLRGLEPSTCGRIKILARIPVLDPRELDATRQREDWNQIEDETGHDVEVTLWEAIQTSKSSFA